MGNDSLSFIPMICSLKYGDIHMPSEVMLWCQKQITIFGMELGSLEVNHLAIPESSTYLYNNMHTYFKLLVADAGFLEGGSVSAQENLRPHF